MMRTYIVASLFFYVCWSASGQGFTDSNLPVVIITTDGGVSIPDEPRVPGTMKIIYRGPGQRNYVADRNTPAYLNYNGRIDIERRGSSSQFPPKGNYGFTTLLADNVTNNNISLLGMPCENDWILGGMVFDTALIRDFLCDNLSRQLGNYASRTAYCEVLVNNDYKGLYILQEKIKANDNRVDVIKITSEDNYLPQLSGGYITKADKTTGGDPVAWTMYSWLGSPVDYIHHLPEPENVTARQANYIKSEFFKLETTAKNKNAALANGFPSVIDIPSFIDFMIINEFASNPDAYMYSTFFHKDRNGKLRAGPVWDLDLSFGNDLFLWGFDRSKPNVWFFQDYQNDGSRFWRDLFNNSQFRCYLSKRWNELIQPGQPLNQASVETFIDQTVAIINEAVARDYTRWSIAGSHAQRIAAIKTFISTRIAWMTTNLGSYPACSNVSVPPLVITKIMYHPVASVAFPDEDKLEFIEIINNGSEIVSLTGIYFRGTGFNYQFPVNSALGPGSAIILASNASVFHAKYGFAPSGQFTRNLSNNSEELILADGFGNVIDYVHYYDTLPWPNADGNGNYLKLADPDLENNLAASWTSSNDIIQSDEYIPFDIDLQLYPNPVTDMLRIQAGSEIASLSLVDIQGRILLSLIVNSESYELDMSHFTTGLYIIRIVTLNKTYTGKVVKD